MKISKVWSAATRLALLVITLTLGSQIQPALAIEPYGLGSHFNERAKYVKYKEAGVQMIRMDISWYHVEPNAPASGVHTYNWTDIDLAFNEAEAQGLKVLVVLGYTNSWATSGPGQPDANKYAPLEIYDNYWKDYINQVVTRYNNRVAAWEIWNEADHNSFFKNGAGTWASNNYPSETAVNKKRLQYKHLVDLALSQAGLASKTILTTGFALGGSSYDSGFVSWLQSQPGWLNQFTVANYHGYGYPSYDLLVNRPTQFRNLGTAIGKNWTHWITEHGINQIIQNNPAAVKTYLIRSYALGLAQQNVTKIFWFRGGYDPDHMDFYDSSGNLTAAWSAYKTLTGKWPSPSSVAPWSSGTASGSIATLAGGNKVAIVWNQNATGGPTLSSLGLSIATAYNQDGTVIPTSTVLTTAPVFLALNNAAQVLADLESSGMTNWTGSTPRSTISLNSANADTGTNALRWIYNDDGATQWGNTIGLSFPTAVNWSAKSQIVLRFKRDAANPASDVGKTVFADWVNNGVSASSGASVGSITLGSGTTYSTYTINMGSFPRTNVSKLNFYVNGNNFDTGNHTWYLDNIAVQ